MMAPILFKKVPVLDQEVIEYVETFERLELVSPDSLFILWRHEYIEQCVRWAPRLYEFPEQRDRAAQSSNFDAIAFADVNSGEMISGAVRLGI